ncbi:MAG: Ig family protein [Verrucomicrobia bacterium]|nr:Ig family protein [Verrucomicrobiota bacterium]
MNFLIRSFACFRIGASLFAIFLGLACAHRLRAEIQVAVSGQGSPSFPRQYAPGTPVQFSVTGSITYTNHQWYHNEVAIPGATSSTYSITNPTATDSGNYDVKATLNGAPDASRQITINVLPFPPSAIDPAFHSSIPADLRVADVFPGASDGSLIVQCYPAADLFNNSVHLSVIRLNSDGSRDPSVFLQTNTNVVTAVLPSGDLIMAFAPHRLKVDGTPGAFTLPGGFTDAVWLGAVVQADGKILLYQGTHIARLNADGSVDAGFNASALPGSIYAVRLDSAGRLTISGTRPDTTPYGQAGYVHRLLSTGADDPGFQQANSIGTTVDGYPLDDGSVFLRYFIFSHEGPFLRKLRADGTQDPLWTQTGLLETRSLVIDPATARAFYIDMMSVIHRATITASTMVDDPTFYGGEIYPTGLKLTLDGIPYAGIYRLLPTQSTSTFPATVAVGVTTLTPVQGSTLTLTARVTGTGPFSYQWLALDGQPIGTDTTSATLSIPNVGPANFGRYQLRVTGAAGAVLSDVVRIGYDTNQVPYLANLSGRAFVGTGDDTAIAGIAVKINAGARGLTTLVRGAGPALQPYGVGGFLPNPVLNLYNAGGQLIGNNDTWGDNVEIRNAALAVGAFPFAANSNDAALIKAFGSSNTTIQLADQSGASGVGLLEVYRIETDPPVPGEILNLSLRARTAPGERVATAGFVIVDPQGFGRTARVVIRVVGPTLSNYGVPFPLTDPVLTLYRSDGTIAAQNNNWGDNTDNAGLAAAMKKVGAFDLATGSKDAAMLLDLPAGVYSVQASNSIGTPDTGVVLIEIYLVR